jgi:hypothetical protein
MWYYDEMDYYKSDYKEYEYIAFVSNYGWRKKWECDIFFTKWNYLIDLFDMIKEYWNEKDVKQWREKILQKFIYSLSDIKSPEALLQGFINSNVFILAEIVRLIEDKI